MLMFGSTQVAVTSVLTAFMAGLALGPRIPFSVRLLSALVVLLVPTALMGGTLPVLSRLVTRRANEIGASVGLLYGLNTRGQDVVLLGSEGPLQMDHSRLLIEFRAPLTMHAYASTGETNARALETIDESWPR